MLSRIGKASMRSLLLCALAIIASISRPSSAEDWPAGEWKMVAGGGSPATSTCIGSYDTIECLADSIAACTAGMEYPPYVPEFLDPPLCLSVPGYKMRYSTPFESWAPQGALLHLYQIDVWALAPDEAWSLPELTKVKPRLGDKILDFYTITCSPNPGCLETIDALAPTATILAACPQTFCTSRSTRVPLSDQPEGPSGLIYEVPAASFLLRPDRGIWRIVDWYSSRLPCMRCRQWLPDHWRIE